MFDLVLLVLKEVPVPHVSGAMQRLEAGTREDNLGMCSILFVTHSSRLHTSTVRVAKQGSMRGASKPDPAKLTRISEGLTFQTHPTEFRGKLFDTEFKVAVHTSY